MKLFQIEEPDGLAVDENAAGAAIGIDASGSLVAVALALGGNAAILPDHGGAASDLRVPPQSAGAAEWQVVFEGARLRAERSLGRPVTHAVVILAARSERGAVALGAEAAGLAVLRFLEAAELGAGAGPAEAAAILAEDLAPRATES
jgi:hypothetical protein